MKTTAATTERGSTPLTLDARVSLAPDLLFSELEGEGVVLNMSSGVYFGLNPVGTRIWTLLGQGMPLPAVRDALLVEFDVDPARCEADLLGVVNQMAADGLVRVG